MRFYSDFYDTFISTFDPWQRCNATNMYVYLSLHTKYHDAQIFFSDNLDGITMYENKSVLEQTYLYCDRLVEYLVNMMV